MAQLVEFPLEDGGSVPVAIDFDLSSGITRGWGDRQVVQAQQSFEQAIARVHPAVRVMVTRLRELADAPDEVHVEFGLELSAAAGAFIAAASSSGNFRVSMTWKSRTDRAAPVASVGQGEPIVRASDRPPGL